MDKDFAPWETVMVPKVLKVHWGKTLITDVRSGPMIFLQSMLPGV